MRQWIISGLGGAPDLRERDAEFAARGGIPRRDLLHWLRATFSEADAVLRRLSAQSLSRRYVIQGYHVTGLAAVAHVYSHFTYHAGQILYITKFQRARDLRLTKLPAKRKH